MFHKWVGYIFETYIQKSSEQTLRKSRKVKSRPLPYTLTQKTQQPKPTPREQLKGK